MKKILFACDLDNTLLHSHRKKREGAICTEFLDGKEQSFITSRTLELLEMAVKSECITFLPVTTRSEEQYKRIKWFNGTSPEYALICNGAILLKNGTAEKKWLSETLNQTESYVKELYRLYEKYNTYSCFKTVRVVDGMFLFVYCNDESEVKKAAEKCCEDTELTVQYSGRKLYFFPPAANKGRALKRFAVNNKYDKIIAAGDSIIDYSMLEIADTALVPDEYTAKQIKNNTLICDDDTPFSDFILSVVINNVSLTK